VSSWRSRSVVGATSWSKEAVEPRSEVGDECEHRLTNVTFVARTIRLEPFAPVVAPQFLQKAEQTTAEMRFFVADNLAPFPRPELRYVVAYTSITTTEPAPICHSTKIPGTRARSSHPRSEESSPSRKSVACITATNVSPTDSYQLLLTVAAEYWRRGGGSRPRGSVGGERERFGYQRGLHSSERAGRSRKRRHRYERGSSDVELSSTSRVVPSMTARAINHLCGVTRGGSRRLIVPGAAINSDFRRCQVPLLSRVSESMVRCVRCAARNSTINESYSSAAPERRCGAR
jgi:hypothetical protein